MAKRKNVGREIGALGETLSDKDIVQIIRNSSDWETAVKPFLQTDTVFPDDLLEFAKFIKYVPWSKQEEIIQSVMDHRKTVVEAGKGTGKSDVASVIATGWLCAHKEDATVVIIAPTSSHIHNVLWRNIRNLAQKNELPGEVLKTARWEIAPDRFAVGLSGAKKSKEDATSLQGYHAKYLLVILDEGAGLSRDIWEAVDGLATASENRILVLGNPIGQAGPFWDACISPAWNRIHVSCLSNPNVVKKKDVIPGLTSYIWVKDNIQSHCQKCEPHEPGAFEFENQWYMPNAYFQANVLGVAPHESDDQLISLAWVISAQNAELSDRKLSDEIVIGLDPSRGGDDACMIARRGGKVFWVKRKRPTSNIPSQELAGWLKAETDKIGASRIYIDDIGIGAGVIDAARVLGLPVIAATFSRAALNTTRFHNLRAEAYWLVREAFQQGVIAIPSDDLLKSDLIAQKYTWDALGRYILEDKRITKARLGRSPDASDALAITFISGGLTNADVSMTKRNYQELEANHAGRWHIPAQSRSSNRWRVSNTSENAWRKRR